MNKQIIFIPKGTNVTLYKEIDGSLHYKEGPRLEHDFHVGSYCKVGNFRNYWRTSNVVRVESIEQREVDNSIMVKFSTVNSIYVLRLETDTVIQYREDLADLAMETGMNLGSPEWFALILKFKRRLREEASDAKDKRSKEESADADGDTRLRIVQEKEGEVDLDSRR